MLPYCRNMARLRSACWPIPCSAIYIETQHFGLDFALIATRTGFALLMAIALLPAVYKNAFDPEKPILVQLCALFASGLGWQSLFQASATAATGTP
jgi:hypothetical protein